MDTTELYSYFLQAERRVGIDSRKIVEGSLFFAIKGERFDGNQFAAQALEKGARYAVVDDPKVAKGPQYLLVSDTLQSLQDLARHHRRQFTIPIIGITGSNGKTTTKELVAGILQTHYATHFTRGNYNNHIGVPLTLLAMPPETEVAVIEMGANHQGEIALLSAIAEPTHGLITNIGKAHLEGFGGIEGVKKGKSELYHQLAKTGGTAFVNRDERWLASLSEHVKHRIFYRSSDEPSLDEPDYETVLLEEEPFLKVAYLDRDGILVEAQSNLYGLYNLNNVMTGITLGKYFKVPAGKIKYAIERYLPADNRSQLLEWRENQILLDAYNANPSSLRQALHHFRKLQAPGKVAILGDMLELGEEAETEHLDIARQLAEIPKLHDRILVGPLFAPAAKKLQLRHFPDTESLKHWLQEQNWRGKTILLKASRGIGLERALED